MFGMLMARIVYAIGKSLYGGSAYENHQLSGYVAGSVARFTVGSIIRISNYFELVSDCDSHNAHRICAIREFGVIGAVHALHVTATNVSISNQTQAVLWRFCEKVILVPRAP